MKRKKIKMKLSITGNAEFFQMPLKGNGNVINETYYIEGILGIDYSKASLKIKIKENVYDINGTKLYLLCQKIKGCEFENIGQILCNHEIGTLDYWKKNLKTYQEIGLIKSLFSVYLWVEPYLLNIADNNIDSEFSIKKNIYDEVILDYVSRIGSVNDMYLLPQEYISLSHEEILNHLMMINLLGKIEINLDNKEDYLSYFIPFIKPGIDRSKYVVNTNLDSYSAWLLFLNLREAKLRKLFPNS